MCNYENLTCFSPTGEMIDELAKTYLKLCDILLYQNELLGFAGVVSSQNNSQNLMKKKLDFSVP